MVVCHSAKRNNYCLTKMVPKFIFFFITGFVCLDQLAKASIIRNNVADFESRVDESMAEAFEKIKLLETEFLPEISNPRTILNNFQEQVVKVITNRVQEFLAELKSFYINLKTESIKSGALPDMNKNLFDLKLLELTPKYMDLLYTDIVAIILNESRMYEDEKLTIISEMLSILEIIKIDIIPQVKNEIADHPQDWTRTGLLGLIFVFGSEEHPIVQPSASEMDAVRRFYDIVYPYQLSIRTHSAKVDTAFRNFYKRLKYQKENQLVETDPQNNQV